MFDKGNLKIHTPCMSCLPPKFATRTCVWKMYNTGNLVYSFIDAKGLILFSIMHAHYIPVSDSTHKYMLAHISTPPSCFPLSQFTYHLESDPKDIKVDWARKSWFKGKKGIRV